MNPLQCFQVSKDDDIFEQIVSEERRAEFFGSSDDLWNLGTHAAGDSDTGHAEFRLPWKY